MATREVASKVLDYWFAIEFLSQDSYDNCTNANQIIREFEKFKKSSKIEKNRRKQISVFEIIDENKDIYSQIKERSLECDMPIWGNLTFFLGKVNRQNCIEKLAKELGMQNFEQAESNLDYIPVLSFQCRNDGSYIKHSLSLSTVVWALSQVYGRKEIHISQLLSEKKYLEDIKQLEEKFFHAEIEKHIISDSNDDLMGNAVSSFDDDTTTVAKIKDIHSELVNLFGKYVGYTEIEESSAIKYQFFKNSRAKERYDDDNYMGLSHDFFSNDLRMVKHALEEEKIDFKSEMLCDLIKYICGPYDMLEEKERHDLIKPKDDNEYISELSEILNIENAPLGKWPSRNVTALMQQVAINFAISNHNRGIFEKNGRIFSVNGPPGTGKTTLLKEIIASNIVEKAIILSKYNVPDEAFEGIEFVHGKVNGAYSKYYPRWYRFKDDRVADYGILVTSCNNAAVENITKELPLIKGILNGLKIMTEGKEADSLEVQKQLYEIRKLFLPQEIKRTINTYTKESKRKGETSEVYFTDYAQKLFGTDEKDADAWGLIAVPLGKKSNINKFYYNVIQPIWQNLLMKNEWIEERLSRYQEVRASFCMQLEKVRELQSKLKSYGDVFLTAHFSKVSYNSVKKANNKLIEEKKNQIENYENEKVDIQIEIDRTGGCLRQLNIKCFETDKRIKEYQKNVEEYNEQKLEFEEKAFDLESSVSFFTKLFRKSKYNTAIQLAQSYRSRADEYTKSATGITELINEERRKLEEHLCEKVAVSQELAFKQNTLNSIQVWKQSLEEEIAILEQEIEDAETKCMETHKNCEKVLDNLKSAEETQRGKILDGAFVNDLFSEDENVVTKAHVANPWVTEEYNREREKLFYLALQMTKEFLLSSKSCRTNLCILGQYWGLKTEDDTEKRKIIFHEKDSQAMIGSLFQTLFLLTPVISSTFASVGRLLKDIKQPGIIGTLVIDEAGQAQPQMAVGALYRSRRAIIVGDPKQVEPVVTDDLNLLKETYSEPEYANYKSKSLSVQSCADIINLFGTFINNGTDYPDWVGCPLLVHRRCISPMYDISNKISYNGLMKQQTILPSKDKTAIFIAEKSKWINVTGSEKGNGDHYVPRQGDIVCKMVEEAFQKAAFPNLYIITPFNKVVSGLRSILGKFATTNGGSALARSNILRDWLYSNIGTIHKFQGKEADEVIFVLGCDETQCNKYAVRGFVNSNMVNVAVTRAKYRLYLIGDFRVWKNNQFVSKAKEIIDTLPIKNIAAIECWEDSIEKEQALVNQAIQLPEASSFVSQIVTNEEGEMEYDIDSSHFVTAIDNEKFLNQDLNVEQFQHFGFSSREKFEALSTDVKTDLLMGMKLYFLLKPVYELADDLDASCCGILFCKGMERQLRKNFVKGLKARFPDYVIKKTANQKITLKNARDSDWMMGTIQCILRKNVSEIGKYMCLKGENAYDEDWWKAFNDKLKSFVSERNKCCHAKTFKWEDLQQLLADEFKEDDIKSTRMPRIGGIFCESEKGKKLNG